MKSLYGVRRNPNSAKDVLRLKGIDFTSINHQSVTTCAEAAAAREIPVENELKSLLLVTNNDHLVMVNLPGTHTINRRCVKAAVGCKRFRFATSDELAVLQLASGTVNPFDLENCPLFYDSDIAKLEYVGTNDGAHNSGVLLSVRDLLRAFPGPVVQLSKPDTPPDLEV